MEDEEQRIEFCIDTDRAYHFSYRIEGGQLFRINGEQAAEVLTPRPNQSSFQSRVILDGTPVASADWNATEIFLAIRNEIGPNGEFRSNNIPIWRTAREQRLFRLLSP